MTNEQHDELAGEFFARNDDVAERFGGAGQVERDRLAEVAMDEAGDEDEDEAIRALQAAALAHSEIPFFHLCTAALEGQHWATERVEAAIEQVDHARRSIAAGGDGDLTAETIRIIRTTDTARPDGAIAKSFTL